MYQEGYVLCVINKGHVLPEEDRRVRLPYNSEFKTRLINKHSYDSGCDLIINGEKIARFLISAGESVNVERFLDGNLSSGKRFTFVSMKDERVKNTIDIENGLIEAHFYKVKPKTISIDWNIPFIPHNPSIPEYPKYPQSQYYYCNTSDGTANNNYDEYITDIKSNNKESSKAEGSLPHEKAKKASSFRTDPLSLYDSQVNFRSSHEGVTVRDKESNQKFDSITGLEYESICTIIKIKLIEGDLTKLKRYCSNCGKKRKHSYNYCSNCGEKNTI